MNKVRRMIRSARNNPCSKWNTMCDYFNRKNRKFNKIRKKNKEKFKYFMRQQQVVFIEKKEAIKKQFIDYKIERKKRKKEKVELAKIRTVELNKIKDEMKAVRLKEEKQKELLKKEREAVRLKEEQEREILRLKEAQEKEALRLEKEQERKKILQEKQEAEAQAREEKKRVEARLKEEMLKKEKEAALIKSEADLKAKAEKELADKKASLEKEASKAKLQEFKMEQEKIKLEARAVLEKQKAEINASKLQLKFERKIEQEKNKAKLKKQKLKLKKQKMESNRLKRKEQMKKIKKILKRFFVKIKIFLTKIRDKNRWLESKTNVEVITDYSPKSYISEAFRTLRTNLQFMNINKNLQTVLITSTMPQEGKSHTAANLAVTFAQANKKVVIVDADMRKGRQDEIFKVEKEPGLSNYLSDIPLGNNKVDDLQAYIKQTNVDGLYVMPMGVVPPNPSELVASEKMEELVGLLKSVFDIVIFDGTPSKIVTDSVILSRQVDTTLIVTSHNLTKMDDLKKVQKDIEYVGGKIAGVVINRFPVKSKRYSNSYYYSEEN